jgi:hypothetical protein
MKLNLKIFISIVIFFNSFFVLNAGTDKDFMKKLEPFVGKWKTLSIYQESGIKAPGLLEYRWILGKKWMFIEFTGNHPNKKNWGAYGFFRYDEEKKCYISYDIFNENEPTYTTGYWLNDKTLRFEEKGKWGIDYTIKPDGSIYQENWKRDKKSKRIITLKTDYLRIK